MSPLTYPFIPTESSLPSVHLRDRIRCLSPQQFKHRTSLVSHPHRLWQIEKGIIRTSTWTEEGVITPLGFWGEGDVVGQALSRVEPFQIECLTDVTASVLPNAQACSQRSLLAHIQRTEELLRIMHIGSTEKRLLQFLSWLISRFGQVNTGAGTLPFRLTHQDMAEAIGTTRVTVTRLLGRLEQEGAVAWSQKRLLLLKGI